MTADFWGLKNAGGTATAYHLMANVLAKHTAMQVGISAVHTCSLHVHVPHNRLSCMPGLIHTRFVRHRAMSR